MKGDDLIKIEELFAKNIKKYRQRREFTQEELAAKCAEIQEDDALSNRSYISDIENCRRNITLDKIGILAMALEVEPYELFLTRQIEEKL